MTVENRPPKTILYSMVRQRPPRFRTIQVYPKDPGALPGHPKPAVSCTAGSGEEPMLDLRRRQFIMLLGGAAAAWPLATHAQQQPKILRVGFVGIQAREAPV